MTTQMLQEIFNVCIVPLLGVLTGYLIKLINKKSAELQAQTSNEIAQKYIQLATTTIDTCVVATNQTYVNALKDKGVFNKEAQEEAFSKTFNAVLDILGEDAIFYLKEIVGDLNLYLSQEIEAAVLKYQLATAE